MGVEDTPPAHVVLADGPYAGAVFPIGRLEDTLIVADTELPSWLPRIDPQNPPVPIAVYELVTELIGPDGDREGTYRYAGHRYPR